MASTYLKTEEGAVNLISSLVSDSALMPLTIPVGCLAYAAAPATPLQKDSTGDLVAGSKIRENEYAKSAAVTGFPLLNVIPGRMVMSYVRPSLETVGMAVAASGARFEVLPT